MRKYLFSILAFASICFLIFVIRSAKTIAGMEEFDEVKSESSTPGATATPKPGQRSKKKPTPSPTATPVITPTPTPTPGPPPPPTLDPPYNPDDEAKPPLEGTYRLDQSTGEALSNHMQQTSKQLAPNNHFPLYKNIAEQLRSSPIIAIATDHPHIAIALAPNAVASLRADDDDQIERATKEQVIVHATLSKGMLRIVERIGDQESAAFVLKTIDPQRLELTGRIKLKGQKEIDAPRTVFRRISNQVELGIALSALGRDYYVPRGTNLTVSLDTSLSNQSAKPFELFSMTVHSFGPYQGAVVKGLVAEVNSKEGRIGLSFETIQLPDGTIHPFGAAIKKETSVIAGPRANSHLSFFAQSYSRFKDPAEVIGASDDSDQHLINFVRSGKSKVNLEKGLALLIEANEPKLQKRSN